MFQKNIIYQNDLLKIANVSLPWENLKNQSILITGATGLIGTVLIDLLMLKNEKENLSIKVYALGRNLDLAKDRFQEYWNLSAFKFLHMDINTVINLEFHFDYIIHAASNTHPMAYASDPIGSIMTNFTGTYNLLNYAVNDNLKRFVFLSSVEIYGEALQSTDIFDESYCGYIDCNTLRAAYPEGKRAGEALCNAFIKQYDMNIVIPRLSRVYGPTMRLDDSKAMSQFILNGVHKEDIILKSTGQQQYSYCYVGDAILGILYILFLGESGEAYNIADPELNLTLKEITQYIAKIADRNVTFQLASANERAGFSKVQRGMLNVQKLMDLGWIPFDNLKTGISKTIQILQMCD